MSKFRLSLGDSIQKIETPIKSGDLHATLHPLSDLGYKSNAYNGKILFNLDSIHIDGVLVRGDCCLLSMYKAEVIAPAIKTPGDLWSKSVRFMNLHLFHYEQDLINDIYTIRPVLSATLQSDLRITLGTPIIDNWKIIKGIYP